MSLDTALQQLRAKRIEPPTFDQVTERRAFAAHHAISRRHLWIAVVSSVIAIVGYVILTVRPLLSYAARTHGGVEEWWRVSIASLVPAVLMLWAARCASRTGVGPQMLARAIWWSNLLVGMLIAGNFLVPVDRFVGAGIALACAIPLLVLGSRGLEAAPGDPFQPVRFRGQLLLALVMAFADAQTLLFSAAMQLRVGMLGWTLQGTVLYAGPSAVAALVMVLIVWGLYRLRTWALILNLVANFAIAWLALDGALNLAPPVALALFGTATCQALLPVPILAIAIGDRKAGRPWLLGHAAKLLPLSVIAIAIAAVVFALTVKWPDGWLTGPGRAFRRGMEAGEMVRDPNAYTTPRRGLPGSLERGALRRGEDLRQWNGSTRFDQADLCNARLDGGEFFGAHFVGARLVGADLSHGNFTFAEFDGADLSNAQLVGANLTYADLRGAVLDGANFEGADLRTALIDAMTPEVAARIRWKGATCPDYTIADETRGCIGRDGRVPDGERSRYERELVFPRWGLRKLRFTDGYLSFFRYRGEPFLYLRRDVDDFDSRTGAIRFEREGDVVRVVEGEVRTRGRPL